MYKNKKIGIIGGGNLGNNTWDLFARNNDVIDEVAIHKFINELDVSEKIKEELYAITPENYTGL